MNNKFKTTLYIPNYIGEKIMNISNHFGEIVENTIYSSIQDKMETLSEDSIIAINNIFKRKDIQYKAIEESLKEMSEPKNKRIQFWESILESNNLPENSKNGIKKIISILEDETPEHIEGDGEEPVDPNPVENPEEENTDQDDSANQEEPPQLTPDQILQIELAQTDKKFMSIVLYDKIIELINTIDTIKDSVSSSKTEENLNLFEDLMMYHDYLNILSELIFVMDLNTVYYNFSNISLEVNDLLDKYLISTNVKILNDPKTSEKERNEITNTLKDNLDEKIETDREIQAEGMK
jgi:hypothetical protein